MKTIEFTRVNNDFCGNPRYVTHFFSLLNEEEQTISNYNLAVKRANKLGGRYIVATILVAVLCLSAIALKG